MPKNFEPLVEMHCTTKAHDGLTVSLVMRVTPENEAEPEVIIQKIGRLKRAVWLQRELHQLGEKSVARSTDA